MIFIFVIFAEIDEIKKEIKRHGKFPYFVRIACAFCVEYFLLHVDYSDSSEYVSVVYFTQLYCAGSY